MQIFAQHQWMDSNTNWLIRELTENAKRKQVIKILEEYVVQLKREMVDEAAENFAPILPSGSETVSL